ncbi:hypothetical protein RB653_006024 [Dictyostelium firmibasis]|uniref:Uncharacterized protein n=1 Tax=Dictyostelium firmibasis TaxID=79012 RepID=A0AAN7UCS1_9MYCE
MMLPSALKKLASSTAPIGLTPRLANLTWSFLSSTEVAPLWVTCCFLRIEPLPPLVG